MIKEFLYKGHHYKVTAIEGSGDDFIIIKDGRKTRRVKKEVANKAIEYVDKLFKP